MMDWLAQHGGLIVTIVFFVMFLGFGIWAYRPANKNMMKSYGDIPFRESRNGQ